MRIKRHCGKSIPLATRMLLDLRAERLTELGADTDAAIDRFVSGECTLRDLAVFKRAMRAAEFLGVATATRETV